MHNVITKEEAMNEFELFFNNLIALDKLSNAVDINSKYEKTDYRIVFFNDLLDVGFDIYFYVDDIHLYINFYNKDKIRFIDLFNEYSNEFYVKTVDGNNEYSIGIDIPVNKKLIRKAIDILYNFVS